MSRTSRNAGRYRFPGKLYDATWKGDDRNDDNEPKPLRDLWLDIIPKTSSEQNTGDQMESVNRFDIKTPWTAEALTTDMEIETERGRYAISGVINRDEADEEWLIMATRISS